MCEKHFTLDIDPERLREVATEVGQLHDHLETKATRTRAIPEEIGEDWTGDTALYVKGEMRSLGLLMDWRMATRLKPLPGEIRTLAGHFDDALAELPGLNRRWEEAQSAYADAITAADTSRDDARDAAEKDGRTNQFDRNEIDDIRTGAVSTASSDRGTTQGNLEAEFEEIRSRLERKVGDLADALVEARPVEVSDQKIEDWQNGDYSDVDRASLLFNLSLTRQRDEMVKRAEAMEEANEDSVEDLQNLYSALDDNDTDAVEAALDEIGDNSENGLYADALLDQLGPEGVRSLYREINGRANDNQLAGPDLYDNLERFSDTIAHGISRTDTEEFTSYYRALTEEQEDTRILALIAASDRADGRLNTAAMSEHRAALSYPISTDSESTFYIMALQEAYGGDSLSSAAIEQWIERSNAGDLAEVLKGLTPGGEIADFMQGLNPNNVSSMGGNAPGVYDDEIPTELTDRYGQVLTQLRDEHLANLDAGDYGTNPALLLQLLHDRGNLSAAGYTAPSDQLQPYLHDVVTDPVFASWYLDNVGDETNLPGAPERSAYKDMLEESGADVEELITQITTYQLGNEDDAGQAAETIGQLLHAQDLLGEDINWDGVVQSLTKDVATTVFKNPLTAPVVGVLDSVISEYQRLEELDDATDNQDREMVQQEVLAFGLYVQANGEPPPGFEDFVTDHNLEGAPNAINVYIDHLGRGGNPDQPELQGLISAINQARDDAG